jgi:hypothetical protein
MNGNCDNGGSVNALDQPGQDENISPPVDEGQGFTRPTILSALRSRLSPNAAVFFVW